VGKKGKRIRQPKARKSESTVKKFPIESEAARDEGPRLIPLPTSAGSHRPGLPSDSFVALAEKAIKLWERAEGKSGEHHDEKHKK
jgi:hypothetical protein